MSNDNDNQHQRPALRKWILIIVGILVGVAAILVLLTPLYGPTIGTFYDTILGSIFGTATPTVENGAVGNSLTQSPGANAEAIEAIGVNENRNDNGISEPALTSVTEEPGSASGSDTGQDSSSDTSPSVGPESLIDTPEPGEPVPPPAPAQVAEVTCTGPPSGWIEYTIQAGDTLSALALTSGSSVAELQRANCLDSEILIAGALFYLPQIPPSPTAIRVQTTAVPTTSVTAVAAVVPTITLLPPTPVPITTTTLPEESNSLLWFLWIVMLVLLVGALIWVWQQRRQTR